jgi:hypothetical protein
MDQRGGEEESLEGSSVDVVMMEPNNSLSNDSSDDPQGALDQLSRQGNSCVPSLPAIKLGAGRRTLDGQIHFIYH